MTQNNSPTTESTEAETDTESSPSATEAGNGTEAVTETNERSSRVTEVDPDVLHQTSPLLQPTLALIGTVVLVALVAVGGVWRRPDLVGGIEFAELVISGIAILAALLLIRLSITLIILWRTTYTIHEEGFKKEYELAYHSKSRELPVEQLRGREYERGRFETVFDCATIRLLTGGTDRSLGFVEFVHVPDPEAVNDSVSQVRKRYERRNE